MPRDPTAEQAAIRADARDRRTESRKVEALAGTGKTTTLEMLAADRRDPGIYLAFNAAIKQEAARRFPGHVTVKTAHGAAYGALRMHDQQERLRGRTFGDGVGRLVRLPHCRMPADALGHVVLETIGRFCNSADAILGLGHVALDPGEPEDIRMAAMEGARSLWGRMSDRSDDCPITHDTYLKLWQLGDARLSGPAWAMFDEAQDASPVMIDILLRQGIPITWVGDSNQAIYGFRGAVNAMRLIPGRSFPLTQSFRFGAAIAEVANAVLARKPEGTGPARPLLGNPARNSQIGRVPRTARHAFISRTNAEWFAEALRVECSVHVLGGIDETAKILEGAWKLWRNGERAARVPVLARFTTWRLLCDHVDRFADRELSFARKVVEQYRDALPQAIAGLRRRHVEHEADASMVLSTAHKAKGREWDLVRLGGGFAAPSDDDWELMSPGDREAELHLLYVASTRAIEGLEPNQAVLDCLAEARGMTVPGQPTPPMRLPEIRFAQPGADLRPPIATAVPGPIHAGPPKRRRVASGTIRGWTGEEDTEALEMAAQGFAVEDIAAWADRHPAAVAVRLAVLGAESSEPGLPAEVLAALVPSHLAPAAPRTKPRRKGAREQGDGVEPAPAPTQVTSAGDFNLDRNQASFGLVLSDGKDG